MARQPNPDLTNTLTMLHTAVVHTDKNIRDALDKSFEKLESSGQAAHDRTTRDVVDELGRMRANFRDVHNKLNSSGEALNTAVEEVVAQLRTELRDVRLALAGLTSPPSPSGEPPVPASSLPATHGADGTGPTLVTTLTELGDFPGNDSLHAGIPAQRTTDDDHTPVPALPLEAVREAVHGVLTEALAPVLAQLAVTTDATTRAGERDVLSHLRDAVDEARAELGAVVEEARTEFAAVQRRINDLRTAVDELRPRSTTTDTPAAGVSPEHSALLRTTARVSSAGLLCHRDIWEFITAHAGRHPHFRVPPQVADEGDERIRAALSGRSLIALLISLHSITHTASEGDGDRELATTIYERIAKSLTGLGASGRPVTITLDDRTAPAPDMSTTEDGTETSGSQTATNTSLASAEQDTDSGDEPSPAA
ncbi:hypothetical protein [Streptomyces tsukubensis]|uniref:hypothetical protein n=1 Tax=Streptomyces tsukubensis TaxID=83656 RepID=UPI0034508664